MNSRRHFFKQLAGEIARGVQEISAATSSGPSAPPAPTPPPAAPGRPRAVPAAATVRGASVAELLGLAAELGLGEHADAIRALARHSLRLVPGEQDTAAVAGGSRLGGFPDLPAGTAWPHWREQPLQLCLQLDLAEAAAALGAPADPLPARGTLWCFSAPVPPSGMRPEHAGACAALLGEVPPDAEPGYGQVVSLAPELVLPRTWSAPVEALALASHEQQAWQELRVRLARLQGVEPGDAHTQLESPHRLLGYPDERSGEMPLACELLDEGIDPGEDPPAAHPRAAALEPRTGRWRLLLQLTLDERLGWPWGERRERLFVWVDEQALAAGDLSRVHAFAR